MSPKTPTLVSTRPTLTCGLLAVVAAALLGAAACGGGDPPQDVVTYVGTASDEAYFALAEREDEAVEDPEGSATLTAPDGAIGGGDPVTFAWELPVDPGEPVGGCGAVSGGLSVRHCPPYSGYIYWLQVLDGDRRLVNVLSSVPEWTPDDEAWSAMTGASGPLTVRLIVAYLVMNELEEGPYLTEATVELR